MVSEFFTVSSPFIDNFEVHMISFFSSSLFTFHSINHGCLTLTFIGVLTWAVNHTRNVCVFVSLQVGFQKILTNK